MVGNYEQVHGWNPFFREPGANGRPQRFHCFSWVAASAAIFPTGGRPDNFNNLAVPGNYSAPVALDHQGHIVPQNILDEVLDPIATQVFNQAPRPATLAALDLFLNAAHPNLGFQHVTAYANHLIANGAPATLFVNPAASDIEEYVGGYFSIIMWNPVNICRAPTDGRRNDSPGNEIDFQVIPRLAIGARLDAAFQAIPPNPAIPNINAFIAAINAELHDLHTVPAGYYQFPWKDEPIAQKRILAPA
jgi:hypothetical protein